MRTLLCHLLLGVLVFQASGEGIDDEGFIRSWLVSGPYPNYLRPDGKTTGYACDFLADVGGEEWAFPHDRQARSVQFVADKGKLIAGIGSVNEWGKKETFSVDATWRAMTFNRKIVDSDRLFTEVGDYFVLYALCYFTSPAERDVRLAVGSDDFHKIWLNDRLVGSALSSQDVKPGNFVSAARLRKGMNKILFKLVEVSQGSGFCVQILGKDGKPLKDIVVDNDMSPSKLADFKKELHPPRPESVVVRENDELACRIKELEEVELPVLRKKAAELERQRTQVHEMLVKSFGVAETNFARKRNQNLVGAPRSVDLPLEGGETRKRLCLNGVWQGSLDGGRTWQPVRVPLVTSKRFFVPWYNPMVYSDPKNPWSRQKPAPGWEDWEMSPFSNSENFQKGDPQFRTEFFWDGAGEVDFVSEGVLGSLKVFCNGVLCGTYDGSVGIVRVALKGLREGCNDLRLILGAMRMGERDREGLVGDVFVEYLPSIRVDSVEIKTGWESASISVASEILNASACPQTLDVRMRVVEGRRIRLELPPVRIMLASNETKIVKSQSKWADPKLWGPGGEYGNPDLYELVTDICKGDVIVDRHRETFGFREFRIFHTDFFLNGRRIVLQGDVGHGAFENKRVRDIAWNAYRKDGVNIIRLHDGAYWSVPCVADADRMGMLMYVQMYPLLFPNALGFDRAYEKAKRQPIIPLVDWVKREEHAWNLANYRRWWKTFRNHPSVVIWSTDNEVLTQSWDSAVDAAFNVRNEQVATLYEKFVKSLDPQCVMTRDGDLSTQNRRQRWFETPPCDTANAHYPDFHIETNVYDWRRTYEWRPVVFGETLYCSYGGWDKWIGPIPSQVEKKADLVRRMVKIYRDEEIPCAVYMGVGLDSYAQEDDTGKGNPWGITKRQKDGFEKNGTPIPGFGPRDYPWAEIDWPSLSGAGLRPVAKRLNFWYYTCELINVYDPRRPAVTRNAVARAYRECLLPQPSLRVGSDAEVLVTGVNPDEDIWATCSNGSVRGVRADEEGRAWFVGLPPGRTVIKAPGRSKEMLLKSSGGAALRPGFSHVQEMCLR